MRIQAIATAIALTSCASVQPQADVSAIERGWTKEQVFANASNAPLREETYVGPVYGLVFSILTTGESFSKEPSWILLLDNRVIGTGAGDSLQAKALASARVIDHAFNTGDLTFFEHEAMIFTVAFDLFGEDIDPVWAETQLARVELAKLVENGTMSQAEFGMKAREAHYRIAKRIAHEAEAKEREATSARVERLFAAAVLLSSGASPISLPAPAPATFSAEPYQIDTSTVVCDSVTTAFSQNLQTQTSCRRQPF